MFDPRMISAQLISFVKTGTVVLALIFALLLLVRDYWNAKALSTHYQDDGGKRPVRLGVMRKV